MIKEKVSFNYLLSRLIITLNIVIPIIAVTFIIIFDHNLATYNLPSTIKELLPRINMTILLVGSSLVLGNIILLLVNVLYSSNQYFKVLEKIDFEDIDSSLNILNSVNNIDEIGNLGEKVSKLLKIYLNYASLYKKRIFFHKLKAKVYLEQMPTAALILDQTNDRAKGFVVSHVNKKGRTLLNIETSSTILGKPALLMLSKNSQKTFLEILTQKINRSSLEALSASKTPLEPVKTTLEFIDLTSSTTLSESKSGGEKQAPNTIVCDVSVFPFIFQFPDDYKYSSTVQYPDNQNITLDSLMVLFWKSTDITDVKITQATEAKNDL